MQILNTPETHPKATRFIMLIEKLLVSCAGYLSDKLYQFSRDSQQQLVLQEGRKVATGIFKNRCLIVGREHYFESSKEYPISNKRELHKVLRFESDDAPYQGLKFQHVEPIGEQSFRVTSWVINRNFLDELPVKPWFIFPESYLLAKGFVSPIKIAAISRCQQTIFVSQSGQGLTSGLQSQYIATLQRFAVSTGSPLHEGNQFHCNQATQFPNLLRDGLLALPAGQWFAFIHRDKQQKLNHFPWKAAAIVSTIMLLLYLSLSSGWLVYQQQQLDKQLSAQTLQVNEALNLQKQFTQQKQRKKVLLEPVQNVFPSWHVWPIIIDSLSTGAKLTAIHVKSDLIRIDGETKSKGKATDVLAKITAQENVIAAKFASPVRNYRNRERFSITFSLTAPKTIGAIDEN